MLRTLSASRSATTPVLATRTFAIGTQHTGERHKKQGGLKRRDSGLGFASARHQDAATEEVDADAAEPLEEPIVSKGAKKLKRRGSTWIKNDQPSL